jgi:hypothetical protein
VYLFIKFLLVNYHKIDVRFKYLAFFGLAYFFSALTEDNLTQPPVYMLAAIFIAFYLRGRKENINSIDRVGVNVSPLLKMGQEK